MAIRTLTSRLQWSTLPLLTAVVASFAVLLNAAGPARALVSSCQPQINGPGTLSPGTVFAPGLRVIKSIYQLGTCDSTITPAARSPDGTIWGVDQGNAKDGLWKSTDDLSTWQLVTTFPDYVSLQEVLPLASGHLLVVARDSDNVHYVLRSTDTDGLSWAPPSLTMPAGAYVHDPQSWFQASDGTIWVPQYQGPSPMNLWKSTDDGQTFSVAYSANADEFHSVEPDPYVPGRIWLCVDGSGDLLSIGYSDNGGASWTWVSQTTYPQARALDLIFTPTAVYWADDAPELPGALYRWDRTSGTVTIVLSGLNAPFMNTFSFNGMYAQFSSVDATADGYIGDEYIHVLTSNNPSATWTETKTPLMRTSGTSDTYALMTGMTSPDSQGHFWAGFYDIGNAQFFDAAIELQLDSTAAYNGITAAFTATPASPAPNHTITFDGSASSTPQPPLSYSWDFGDGSTGSGSVVTHSYSTSGSYPVRLQVSDANSDVTELTQVVTVAPAAPAVPVVTTNLASSISFNTAALNASVNPSGADTTAHFDWGRSTAYGSQTASQHVGAGTSSQPYSAVLSGLSPNTTYHYRISASNAAGSAKGQDATFATGPLPPVATTRAATSITRTAAQLNGTVNPGGRPTTYYFQYGTTASYTSQTPTANAGSGTAPKTVSTKVNGLQRATTYHMRLVATNASGTSFGQDFTFKTTNQTTPSDARRGRGRPHRGQFAPGT